MYGILKYFTCVFMYVVRLFKAKLAGDAYSWVVLIMLSPLN